MRRRLVLMTLAAVALVLAAAVPALAGRATSAEPYGWDLQLRNMTATKYNADLTARQFAAWVAKAHRQATVVQNGVTFKGPSLKTLVGYFDDGDKATFNARLAAAGYTVVVLGMDGYSASLSSADVASLGDKLVVASLGDGAALPVPKAFLRNGQPVWEPDWPLRLATSDPSLDVNDLVFGIVRVTMLPLVSPNQPYEPYAWDLQLRNTVTKRWSADMTSRAWSAWMGKARRQVSVTETLDGTAVRFSGVSLRTLVGYFDDRDRDTFNTRLAAKGYGVTVLGMDGYSATFSSAQIEKLGDHVIMASLADGAPLKVPKAFLYEGQPLWVPSWPLRVASDDADVITDDRVLGVVRVSIVPLLK